MRYHRAYKAKSLPQTRGDRCLIGSPSDIVETLTELADAVIDGVLMSWVDPIGGLKEFSREVMPLLEKKGPRAPISARTAA
ncbi:hypothetical protein N2599_27965 (plasmid) [Rhizobium sullae]|uniref:Luciferase-like monooxygenase n=1 Tax=Rhizobium sullae TaxID=50338 RepID=A0ABY5XPY1_RHISU|nr:hypothetical protein [Rhizobium sullae]UWU16682.1 hypothetical protein N2599_27965 [Rhizobium sullae]